MKRYIKSAQGKQRYKFKFEISQVWYEDGETIGDTWQEFAYATAENPLNARIKIENRLEKEYGSKNDEWELVLKVIEGPDGYEDDMKYSSREGYVPVDDVHSEEDVFESIKTNKKSIKASEFIVTVGDVEEYYIEADNEDDALQEFLDLYAEPEDLEEYEEDPSYIWVRESEDD